MKIQCDVCNHEPATLFCCADEAALCSSCDRHIHRANKLSIKHHRLPFLSPSPSSPPPPLCDICQDKRAFIFCQQDRAIICRDCDAAIHTNNYLTENHSRFLLAGVRISSSPADPNSSSDQPEKHTSTTSTSNSSFSDYLIKTLPGWQVEDLLVDDAAEAAAAHFQVEDLADEIPSWAAPHVPRSPAICFSDATSAAAVKQVNYHSKRQAASDDAFRVPQLSPAITGGQNKRQRTSVAPSPSSSSYFSYPLFWYH